MTRHRDEFDIMMERIATNKDVERGLTHLSTTPNNQTDPVVREMATAVLQEIQRAKNRREMNNCLGCFAIIIIIIVLVVITLVGGWPKGRHH